MEKFYHHDLHYIPKIDYFIYLRYILKCYYICFRNNNSSILYVHMYADEELIVCETLPPCILLYIKKYKHLQMHVLSVIYII